MMSVRRSHTVARVESAGRRLFSVAAARVRPSDLVRRSEKDLLLIGVRGRDCATASRATDADIGQRRRRYRVATVSGIRVLFVVGLQLARHVMVLIVLGIASHACSKAHRTILLYCGP